MFKRIPVRFGLIAVLIAICGWFLYQNYEQQGSIVTLGLDLQGGTHLALEVEDPEGVLSAAEREDAIDRALTVIRSRIDELGVAEPTVQKTGADRIVVELPGLEAGQESRAKDIIQQSAFLRFQIARRAEDLDAALPRLDRAVLEGLGRAEAEPPAGEELPAEDEDPEEEAAATPGLFTPPGGEEPTAAERDRQPFSSRLTPTGIGSQYAVREEDVPEMERYLAMPEVQQVLPRGTDLLWEHATTAQQAQAFRRLYLLHGDTVITGERLVNAQAQRDPQTGAPLVTFQFDRRGGRIFERATGQNIGEELAIILDNRVVSAPVIRGQIAERGQIELGTGSSMEEARDLALVLRAGALPVPLEIIEERTVGPSLGRDSIDQGMVAGIIGIILVILTMMFYYRLAGVMAVVALSLYVILLMGGLAVINATLTLPGIAGLILSIGMAVDANVLIFERIREELQLGRGARSAVNEGFQHALSAIVDANLTTLITAIILFYFGTGPVRGFAIILGIGIIASMFTAIFITRTFFMVYLERKTAGQTVSI
jgi:protein-export membrane protein SecD